MLAWVGRGLVLFVIINYYLELIWMEESADLDPSVLQLMGAVLRC